MFTGDRGNAKALVAAVMRLERLRRSRSSRETHRGPGSRSPSARGIQRRPVHSTSSAPETTDRWLRPRSGPTGSASS